MQGKSRDQSKAGLRFSDYPPNQKRVIGIDVIIRLLYRPHICIIMAMVLKLLEIIMVKKTTSRSQSRKIPVCLVTGFLGSGKTTFLMRLAEHYRNRRIVFIVNEFADRDIDSNVLDWPKTRLRPISGGSIFCRCLAGDFVDTLRDIIEPNRSNTPPTEGIVIEASGIANPKVIEQMLSEYRLDSGLELKSVVTIVDPFTFLKLSSRLPNIDAQIEASDIVIINKIDSYFDKEVERTEKRVRTLSPGVSVHKTSFCSVVPDIFSETHHSGLRGEYALCADPNFAVFQVPLEHEMDLPRLRKAIESEASTLYRAKGLVKAGRNKFHVDYINGQTAIRLARHMKGTTGLVLIFQGDAKTVGEKFTQRLAVGEFCKREPATV